MKITRTLTCCLILFIPYLFHTYADSGYKEIPTPQGKIITGLNREEALKNLGLPSAATEDLWYYPGTEKTFVYLPSSQILKIYLYPQDCKIAVGDVLEYKAFGYYQDLKIRDITSQAQLLINEPQDFIPEKAGIIIPKKAGEYQLFVRYEDVFSNPAYLSVEDKPREKPKETKRLLAIDILPFKPQVRPGSNVEFVAMGTFLDLVTRVYFIKDITRDVRWFVQQNQNTAALGGNNVYFTSLGKAKVFCRYKNLESYLCEVEIADFSQGLAQTMRHITLLPELISAQVDNNVWFAALGTYQNNKVEDITRQVSWKISNRGIAAALGRGKFLLENRGVTEVAAELANIKSPPAKIFVRDIGGGLPEAKKGPPLERLFPEETVPPKTDRIATEVLSKEIKNDVDRLSKNLLGQEKELKAIKIAPDYLKIPLKEEGRLSASGIYSDNSQEDLTLRGEWVSLDSAIAAVDKGRVTANSPGEVNIYLEFRGKRSLPAKVAVGGPGLVSIVISPENAQISLKQRLNLQAEGYYSDSSHRDITPLVEWKAGKSGVIRMDKASIIPQRAGRVQVYAEYLGIKSRSANIKVIFTLDWLVYMLIKCLLLLLAGVTIAFVILYFLTRTERNKLLAYLDNDPRGFIIGVYENTKNILAIFGSPYNGFDPPMDYARSVQQRYAIADNLVVRVTQRFEEAKYSRHILKSNEARLILTDYNNILKTVLISNSKPSLIFRYLLTLAYRRPLLLIPQEPLS